MSAVLRKQCGHQWICNSLQRSIRHCKQKCARPKKVKGQLGHHSVVGPESHNGRQDMQRESDNHELSVPDFVGNDASNDNSEAEAGEACAIDETDFEASETEFGSPDFKNA